MWEIFGFKANGHKQEQAQREQIDQSLDRTVRAVQRQANELVEDIRRARRERERRMLREALGGDN